MRKRITAYKRVSTKSDEQKSSFINQDDYFMQKLKEPEFKDCEVVEFYFDYGISGTSLKRRAGFIQLLKDAGLRLIEVCPNLEIPHPSIPNAYLQVIKFVVVPDPNVEAKFDEILFKQISRFGRNINGYEILEALFQKGIHVRFLDDDLLIDSKEKLAIARKKLDEAMSFSENLSRTISTYHRQRESKDIPFQKLYGYDYHYKDKRAGIDPYYTINEHEAEAVKKMFELVAEGMSERNVSRMLASLGYLTRRGKPIDPSTIPDKIRNEKYKGYNFCCKFTYGTIFERTTSMKVRDNYSVKQSKSIPAIVSEELWQQANDSLRSRVKVSTNKGNRAIKPPRHKYKDLLKCGLCGNHFSYLRGGNGYYFRCCSKERHGADACRLANITDKAMEDYMNSLMGGGLADLIDSDYYNNILSVITYLKASIKQLAFCMENDSVKKREAEYSLKLDAVEQKKAALLQLIANPSCDPSTIKQLTDTLNCLIEEGSAIREKMQNIAEPNEDRVQKIRTLFDVADSLIETYKNNKREYSEEELFQLLDRIEVFGELNGKYYRPKGFKNIFHPILKSSVQLTTLADLGYTEWKFKIRDWASDYEAPDDTESLHIVDDDTVSKAEKTAYLQEHSQTKSHWLISSSPYPLNMDIQEILPNLGFQNQKDLDVNALCTYTNNLKQQFEELLL